MIRPLNNLVCLFFHSWSCRRSLTQVANEVKGATLGVDVEIGEMAVAEGVVARVEEGPAEDVAVPKNHRDSMPKTKLHFPLYKKYASIILKSSFRHFVMATRPHATSTERH